MPLLLVSSPWPSASCVSFLLSQSEEHLQVSLVPSGLESSTCMVFRPWTLSLPRCSLKRMQDARGPACLSGQWMVPPCVQVLIRYPSRLLLSEGIWPFRPVPRKAFDETQILYLAHGGKAARGSLRSKVLSQALGSPDPCPAAPVGRTIGTTSFLAYCAGKALPHTAQSCMFANLQG